MQSSWETAVAQLGRRGWRWEGASGEQIAHTHRCTHKHAHAHVHGYVWMHLSVWTHMYAPVDIYSRTRMHMTLRLYPEGSGRSLKHERVALRFVLWKAHSGWGSHFSAPQLPHLKNEGPIFPTMNAQVPCKL